MGPFMIDYGDVFDKITYRVVRDLVFPPYDFSGNDFWPPVHLEEKTVSAGTELVSYSRAMFNPLVPCFVDGDLYIVSPDDLEEISRIPPKRGFFDEIPIPSFGHQVKRWATNANWNQK